MWQSLFDELKDAGFVVLAVALDDAQAARPWIEAAKAAYPCLIDRDHHVADLYNMVNVPQAVWIDERGQVVRPLETAGSTDGFRKMDRVKFTIAPEVMEERNRVKQLYLDAIRDWARQGAASRHVLPAQAAAERVPRPDDAVAQAHAFFRLGRVLLRMGRDEEAGRHMKHATDLHPDSWSMFRQSIPKDERGLATQAAFWNRVDALGDRPYYAPTRVD